MRRRLTALIDAEPDLVVCASAATQRDALVAIAATKPDLGIVNLFLGDSNGLDLVRDVRARFVRLPPPGSSMHDSPQYVRRAFESGTDGCVAKQEMTEDLLVAIRSVLLGDPYGAPAP
ncbi:response regulator [Bradyrhizobium sp. HKCCYLRH2060]|uniref:response regulator n=1 Tax=Bradyrhizobium TaxID=374 RepID=UPI002916FB6E|nr:response regulator [Bradyrhizobium sp. SZCCHNR3003]